MNRDLVKPTENKNVSRFFIALTWLVTSPEVKQIISISPSEALFLGVIMMADWRKLHGKICENQELGECSLGANLLFERILIKTDDEGRYYADSTLINKLVFTARKDIKDKQINNWLEELVEKNLICLYKVDNKKYLCFCNFHKYQQLRKDIKPKIFFPTPPVTDTEQPVTDTKQPVDIRGEERRRDKKKFLEFVYLTNKEEETLIAQFGEAGAKERIENLNAYLGSKGDKYKSHYHTILNWERKNKSEKIPEGAAGRELRGYSP